MISEYFGIAYLTNYFITGIQIIQYGQYRALLRFLRVFLLEHRPRNC